MAVLGIGVDMAKISRFEKWAKSDGILHRFFSHEEVEIFKKKNFPSQSIAGRFAAKEAFIKATGFSGQLRNISVVADNVGRPEIILRENASSRFSELNDKKFFVSISHDGDYAVAFVVLTD